MSSDQSANNGGNSNGRVATLIIDASQRDSDLLYVSRFAAGDPFTYVEVDGRRHLILSDLEMGRGEKEAAVDEIVSYSRIEKELKEQEEIESPGFEDVVIRFLQTEGVKDLKVPARFPTRYADRLRNEGFKVEVGEDPFCPNRAVKSADEVALLEAAQAATEAAMLGAIDRIRSADVGDGGMLVEGGAPLTAEAIKRGIRRELLEKDYLVADIIVAPGDQGCDPHNSGSGPIHAGESVIIDIFPRHIENHYWGDMTRTVCKGEASAELAAVHRSVARAQEAAVAAIRPGATGADVHQVVQDIFEEDGFVTEQRDGGWVGFFHGTGHGIGLDIHEGPRLSKTGGELSEGMVITVEPGLYYPGIGGVRIEDIVVVTADGCRNLNSASRDLVV